MKYDEQEGRVATILSQARDRCGMNVGTLAGHLDLEERTIYHWLAANNPLRARFFFAIVRIFNEHNTHAKAGTWMLNRMLRDARTGLIAVPKVERQDESLADLGERLGGGVMQLMRALGRASGSVAEAQDPGSDGGKAITPLESQDIEDDLDTILGIAAEMKARLHEEARPTN